MLKRRFTAGVLFPVGVPTPDAAPAVAAQERLAGDRAAAVMLAGPALSAVGGAALAGRAVARLVGRRT